MERWSVGGHQGWRTGVFSRTSLGKGKGKFGPIVVTLQMDGTDNDDKTTDVHNMHRYTLNCNTDPTITKNKQWVGTCSPV
jgi:hypothetical protein